MRKILLTLLTSLFAITGMAGTSTRTISSFSASTGNQGALYWAANGTSSNKLTTNSGGNVRFYNGGATDSVLTSVEISIGHSSSGTTTKAITGAIQVSDNGSDWTSIDNDSKKTDYFTYSGTYGSATSAGVVTAAGYNQNGKITITMGSGHKYVRVTRGDNNFHVTAVTFTLSYSSGGGCTSITPTLSYASVGGTTLAVGSSSSGSPTVSGNSGSGAVTYAVSTSSPSGCATVNPSTGVVTGVAAGTATVTASIGANGGYCAGSATASFTITSCSTPTISTSPSSANYCQGDTPTALSFSGSGHNAQKWQYYDGDSWEDTGTTTATYSPSTSSTGSTQYRVVTTCDNYDTYYTASSAATIGVKTNPNLSLSRD